MYYSWYWSLVSVNGALVLLYLFLLCFFIYNLKVYFLGYSSIFPGLFSFTLRIFL